MQAGCTNLYISVRVCVCMMVSLKIDFSKIIAKPLRHTSKLNRSKISVCLHVNSLCTFKGGMSTQIDKVFIGFFTLIFILQSKTQSKLQIRIYTRSCALSPCQMTFF